ncbi:MAG: hypothetical protein GX606_00155 [Elusimicrobia bacterium]|nr:hypothetical protein [Elusimicrobiota bacterium]
MSLTYTDIVTVVILFLLALRGASEGFWRSLIWPASITVSYLIFALSFATSRNLIMSGLAAVVASFLTKWLLGLVFKRPSDETPPPALLSRIGGIAIQLSWSTALALILITCLALAPLGQFGLGDINDDAQRSHAYGLIKPFIVLPKNKKKITPRNKDLQAMADDPAVQVLLEDERIRSLIEDKAFLEAAEKRDIQKILNDPRIQELQKDPTFLVKIMRIYATLNTAEPE